MNPNINKLKEQIKKVSLSHNKKNVNTKKQLNKLIQVLDQIPIFPYQIFFKLIQTSGASKSKKNVLQIMTLILSTINYGYLNPQLSKQTFELIHNSLKFPSAQKLHKHIIPLIESLLTEQNVQQFLYNFLNILLKLLTSIHENIKENTFNLLIKVIKIFYQRNTKFNQFIKIIKSIIQAVDGEVPNWYIEGQLPKRQVLIHLLNLLYSQNLLNNNQLNSVLRKLKIIVQKNLKQSINSIAFYQKQKQRYGQTLIQILIYGRCLARIIGNKGGLLDVTQFLSCNKSDKFVKYIIHQIIKHIIKNNNVVQQILYHQLTLQKILELIDLGKSLQIPNIIQSNLLQLPVNFQKIQNNNYSFTLLQLLYSIQKYLISVNINLNERYSKNISLYGDKQIYEIVKVGICTDEQKELRTILKIIEKSINIFGVFRYSKVVDKFVRLLVKNCIPKDGKIDYLHVVMNKMLFNIIISLGQLLPNQSLILIFQSIQPLQSIYQAYLLGQSGNVQRQADVQILTTSLNSIFIKSNLYSQIYLKKMIQCMFQAVYEQLENKGNRKGIIQKMEAVVNCNVERMGLIWEIAVNSLLCLCTSKSLTLRFTAISILSKLIYQSLKFSEINQSQIFSPWYQLLQCQYNDLKEPIFTHLKKSIIDNGHIINGEGWAQIIKIIQQSIELQCSRKVFDCIQILIQMYLQVLDSPFLLKLIDILDNFKQKTVDQNIKYSCLTLLWNISDYVSKTQNQDFFVQCMNKVVFGLLDKNETDIDNIQSSFHILSQLLIHNCNNLSYNFWYTTLNQIFTNLINQPSFNKPLLPNLLKILKKLIQIFPQQQKYKFSIDMIYQVIIRAGWDGIIDGLKVLIELLTVQYALKSQGYYKYFQFLLEGYTITNDTKKLKLMVTYLPQFLYEFLQKGYKYGHLYTYKLVIEIAKYKYVCLKQIKNVNLRIYFDQKAFQQFLYKISCNEQSFYQHFFQLFSQLTNCLAQTLLKRLIEIMGNVIKQCDLNVFEKFLQLFNKIIVINNQNQNINKQQMSLWHNILLQLINFQPNYLQTHPDNSHKLLKFFFNYLQQPTQDDSLIINYIVNNYFHNQKVQLKQNQIRQFVNKIYNKQEVMFKMVHTQAYHNNHTNAYSQILIKRKTIVFPILIQRVQQIFKNFLQEDKRFLNMPKSQTSNNQIQIILGKLYKLTIDKEMFSRLLNENQLKRNSQNPIYINPHGHLFYLLPYFNMLQKIKSIQIGRLLYQIYSTITQQLRINSI